MNKNRIKIPKCTIDKNRIYKSMAEIKKYFFGENPKEKEEDYFTQS